LTLHKKLTLQRIRREALPHDTLALAKTLIGLVLVRDARAGLCAGKIVEVEAYVGNDPASHAYRGQTSRNRSMFLEPFRAYVYRIYGTSFCFNVTAQSEGEGEAVLVRALEPLEGLPLMMERRGTQRMRDLCRGPGRLCQALSIDSNDDGQDLIGSADLYLADARFASPLIRKSKRIGITKAAHRHLRFYERGNPFVSGPKHLNP